MMIAFILVTVGAIGMTVGAYAALLKIKRLEAELRNKDNQLLDLNTILSALKSPTTKAKASPIAKIVRPGSPTREKTRT